MLNLIRPLAEPILRKNLLLFNFFTFIYYYAGYIFYIFFKLFKKPYIGGYLFSNQDMGRKRQKTICNILKSINKKQINILEIGVFCGQTTLKLSNECKKNNIDYNITCLDLWDDFELSQGNKNFQYKKIIKDLKNQNIFKLFKYNIKTANIENKISIVRENSIKYLRNVENKFDLIIIDGSHLYDVVFQDIKNSLKAIKDGGIIIGDDYEVLHSDLETESLVKLVNKKVDIAYDKNLSKIYHPGVTYAVNELLGNLNSFNGLFCVKKQHKVFKDYFNDF